MEETALSSVNAHKKGIELSRGPKEKDGVTRVSSGRDEVRRTAYLEALGSWNSFTENKQ